MKNLMLALLASVILLGCSSAPTPVAPVINDFEAERYLGKWYEIIRLPHSFEEGLDQVTAEYRLNADNTIEVTNRGYNVAEGKWETAIGHAEPIGLAMYRVTFFWPFDGGYYISQLHEDARGNYQVSVVTSDNHDYFWLLSRSPDVSEEVIEGVLKQAESWGYDTSQMIRVNHPTGSH